MQTGRISFHFLARIPNTFIETSEPAVQVIDIVVLSELIVDSIQREPAATNAICMTPYQRPEVARIADVFFQAVEAKHDVTQSAVSIRNFERRDRTAISRKCYFQSTIVRESVE